MSSVKAACFAMLVLASVQRMTTAATACDNETSVYCTTWIMNTGDEFSTAPFLDNVLTDVQAVEVDGDYLRILASGIPKFTTVISNEIFEFLESRPKASSDFEDGVPSVSVGDLVEWGGGVGYTGKQGCAAGSSGYWPTGPSCPSDQNLTAYIPMQPTFTESVCYQPLGNIGLFSNGVAVYGLLDGTSYNSDGTWNSLAPKFEIYDVDINGGHAQTSGQYHIHATTNMMPALKGENNSDAKSSVWGFAADGFPILGPYIADGVEAQSCWKARNYYNDSLGGCGTEGERSCLLVDIFDLSQGTVPTSLVGPNVRDNVTTQSGNTISGESGIYLEDFYYDAACTAQGDEYLDEHNGRMDDELGYVYHMTSSFPYNLGPTFKGKLHANGLVSSCQASSTTSSSSSSSTSSSSTRTSHPTTRPSRSSKPSASRETSASDDDDKYDDDFESAETMSPSDATRSLPQMMFVAVLVTLISLR